MADSPSYAADTWREADATREIDVEITDHEWIALFDAARARHLREQAAATRPH